MKKKKSNNNVIKEIGEKVEKHHATAILSTIISAGTILFAIINFISIFYSAGKAKYYGVDIFIFIENSPVTYFFVIGVILILACIPIILYLYYKNLEKKQRIQKRSIVKLMFSCEVMLTIIYTILINERYISIMTFLWTIVISLISFIFLQTFFYLIIYKLNTTKEEKQKIQMKIIYFIKTQDRIQNLFMNIIVVFPIMMFSLAGFGYLTASFNRKYYIINANNKQKVKINILGTKSILFDYKEKNENHIEINTSTYEITDKIEYQYIVKNYKQKSFK